MKYVIISTETKCMKIYYRTFIKLFFIKLYCKIKGYEII